tara:strand:+ start:1009 stop:1509 length:501 start_codon:yes stop_codon:yes gene_type:complete
MAIAMLIFSLGLMWNIHGDGLVIGWIEERGPGSGVWPFWLSFGMALCSIWTILRWANGTTAESKDRSPYFDPDSLSLVAFSFFLLTVMIFVVQYIGTYLAVASFLGVYMRVVGKHTWRKTLGFMSGSVIFIYFLFEWQLAKYLPKGLPIFEDAFLWLDNYRWEYLM